MADRAALLQLIEAQGGVLARSKKHQVYLFPGGKQFTIPCTPRCPRAYANAISDLKRLLGLYELNRGQAGKRRERKRKSHRIERAWTPQDTPPIPRPSWKDKLAVVKAEIFPKK